MAGSLPAHGHRDRDLGGLPRVPQRQRVDLAAQLAGNAACPRKRNLALAEGGRGRTRIDDLEVLGAEGVCGHGRILPQGDPA